jgi:hypothetical protein
MRFSTAIYFFLLYAVADAKMRLSVSSNTTDGQSNQFNAVHGALDCRDCQSALPPDCSSLPCSSTAQCCNIQPSEVGACSRVVPESAIAALLSKGEAVAAIVSTWALNGRVGKHIGLGGKIFCLNIPSGNSAGQGTNPEPGSKCDPCRPVETAEWPNSFGELYCTNQNPGGSNLPDGRFNCYPALPMGKRLACNPGEETNWYGGWDVVKGGIEDEISRCTK